MATQVIIDYVMETPGNTNPTFEPYANPAQGPQNIIIEIPNQTSSTEENK